MTLLDLPDPNLVVIAGDWHGNTGWATTVIREAGNVLEGQSTRLILQLGDFGIDGPRRGGWYLTSLSRALITARVTLAFIDGNHENHDELASMRKNADPVDPVEVSDGIWHLPRGCRWTWHEKEWLTLGGAASPDRAPRIRNGWGWWEGEYITEADILRAVGQPARKAHVMLTHEAPDGSPVRYMDPPPSFWAQEDLDMGETHRRAIRSVAEAVQADHLFHGHHHQAYQSTVQMAHGPVEVSGLDMDGELLNWNTLDARTATWGLAPGRYELPRREAAGG